MEEGRGKGYKFIDHTADIEFVAKGATVEKMLGNALLAMFDAQADLKMLAREKSAANTFVARADGSDLGELLWKVLQDALSKGSARGLFGYRIGKVAYGLSKSRHTASVKCYAKKMRPEAGKFEVKGVSRFDLQVKENRGFEATVVLDV